MSVLSSTSPIMLNTPGLFSSRTAFQRPKLNASLKVSQSPSLRSSIKYSEEIKSKRSYKPIQSLQDKEESEPVFCEPVKKVKFVPNLQDTINLLETNKSESKQKPYKLTKEMVFDTPIKAKKTQSNNLFDDENEDSDLSFISSCSDVNELEVMDEEEIAEINKEQSYNITTTGKSDAKFAGEPLVVKHGLTNQINYLTANGCVIPNVMNYPVMTSYNPYSNLNQFITFNNSFNGIPNLNQLLQPNLNSYYPVQTAINYSSINMNDFIRHQANFMMEDNDLTHFNNLRAKIGDSEADGYDSDSHATRSTGMAASQEGVERSQKSLSPPYNATEEAQMEDRIQITPLEKAKKKIARKPKNTSDVEGSLKIKKGRALNLDIDINPKHLKVERRLNKLQLLRYQQEAPEAEFEDYMKKLTASKDSSLFNDTTDSQSIISTEDKAMIIEPKPVSYHNTLATIPEMTFESSRRRTDLVAVWTPEGMSAEDLSNYMQSLSEILEILVTDQEKALNLLKSFGMDVRATLEAVIGNKAEYTELLRMKVKRVRRH